MLEESLLPKAECLPDEAAVVYSPDMAFWRDTVWKQHTEGVAAIIVSDALKTLLALALLTVVYMGIRLLALMGYPANRIDVLETLHYWAVLPLILMFITDLLTKIFSELFTHKG